MTITRYPGIASFEDSEISSRLFFGREEESKLLLFSILSEFITVLFSKSGYGKTSILQTDVFKKLRERGFYPIQVRFNMKEFLPAQLIISEIKTLAAKDDINEIVVPDKEENLKDFFSKLAIWSPDDKLLNPVLIFDQFEEIFTLKHNTAGQVSFFQELAEVINACKEGTLSVKMVFSLREDFLGNLENLSVKIPSIFTNRFRLEALTKKSAQEAIVTPASLELEGIEFESPPFYYSDNAVNALLNFLSLELVEGKWEPSAHVEPVQLQIVCSEMEARVKNGLIKKSRDGSIRIETSDLGGDAGLRAILGHFYDTQLTKLQAVLGLQGKEMIAIRNLIEKELIAGKRRVPVDYDSITRKADIKKEAIDLLIKNKLLKEVTYESSSLVEISHDSLVEPVLESYEERRKQEVLAIEARRLREKRNKIIIATVAIALLVSLGLFVWGYIEQREADSQRTRANNAVMARDKAVSQLAIALEELKKKKADSLSHTGSFALRTDTILTQVPVYPPNPAQQILPGVKPAPESDTIAYQNLFFDPNSAFISISGDGTKMFTADKKGHSHLYDIAGDLEETFTQPGPLTAFDFSVAGITLLGSRSGTLSLWDKDNRWSGNLTSMMAPVTMVAFSPQFGSPRYMKYILFTTADGKAGVLDLFGRTIKKLETEAKITAAAFSPDGKNILTGSADGIARIWKFNADYPSQSLINKKDGAITAIALSPDGKRLVTGSGNGNATVWDIDREEPVVTIAGNRGVSGLTFKKQANNLYIGYSDGTIRLFSILYNGKEYTSVAALREYRGHKGPIQSMYFRESDNRLFTTSADGSAKVWVDR